MLWKLFWSLYSFKSALVCFFVIFYGLREEHTELDIFILRNKKNCFFFLGELKLLLTTIS